MRVREKQVHYGETENHDGEIKNAQLRGAGSAPTGIAGKPQIKNVSDENQQRDDVLGVVMPDVAGEAVDPDEAEGSADSDGNEADEDAALAHAIEKIERWEAPDDIADAMFVEEALFAEVDEAEYAGEAEGGVGQDAERYVKCEDYAGGGWSGEAVWRRELREEEKCQNEWEHERADRALAVKKLEAEVGECQEPAEEGHGAGKVVVGDSVEAASAFEQREIMGYQTASQ